GGPGVGGSARGQTGETRMRARIVETKNPPAKNMIDSIMSHAPARLTPRPPSYPPPQAGEGREGEFALVQRPPERNPLHGPSIGPRRSLPSGRPNGPGLRPAPSHPPPPPLAPPP